jgi:hypothetical protein
MCAFGLIFNAESEFMARIKVYCIVLFYNLVRLYAQSFCSSVFRELKKYQKEFSSWCGECQREKKERQLLAVGATKLVGTSDIEGKKLLGVIKF